MAEYIERDALIENLREFQKAEQRLYNWATSDAEKNKRRSWIGAISVCISEARNTPTADVVEVVRCKDCRYWQDNNGGYPHEDCRWGKGETPDADDYCSFGAKMDGKGER